MTLRLGLLFAGLLLAGVAGLWLLGPLAAVERLVAWRFPDVAEVTTGELADRLAAGEEVVLLDARERAEFDVSHLPGALWIGPSGANLSELGPLPADRPVIVYCAAGWRSAEAARLLSASGVTRVENLRGSIFRWVGENRPLVDRDGRPTANVHPVSPVWGFLLSR